MGIQTYTKKLKNIPDVLRCLIIIFAMHLLWVNIKYMEYYLINRLNILIVLIMKDKSLQIRMQGIKGSIIAKSKKRTSVYSEVE